jgi:hypothetical protein
MQLRETRSAGRCLLEASVTTTDWAPGTYCLRATVTNAGAPLAAPTRSIVLDRNVSAPPSSTLSASAAIASDAAASAAAPGRAPSEAAADDIVERGKHYLETYLEQGATVVAEEHYVQITRRGPPALSEQNVDTALEWRENNDDRQRDMHDAMRRRQLVSDLLMVKTRDGVWTNYRDVAIVDGRTQGNRSKRALDLFVSHAADLGARLREIANESTRYNLMAIGNFNIPTLPLMVLRPGDIDRFAFARAGDEVIDGVPVAVITYRETEVRRSSAIARMRTSSSPASCGWRRTMDGCCGRR